MAFATYLMVALACAPCSGTRPHVIGHAEGTKLPLATATLKDPKFRHAFTAYSTVMSIAFESVVGSPATLTQDTLVKFGSLRQILQEEEVGSWIACALYTPKSTHRTLFHPVGLAKHGL